nr:hypothetical protein [uncultured Albidiferax sp.]
MTFPVARPKLLCGAHSSGISPKILHAELLARHDVYPAPPAAVTHPMAPYGAQNYKLFSRLAQVSSA